MIVKSQVRETESCIFVIDEESFCDFVSLHKVSVYHVCARCKTEGY